jgi:anti-sigma regulatory factor (Ser/Thr protein kinase)
MATVRLDVAPDQAYVRVVRLVAVSLARLNGITEEVVENVRLAVGEACGRAVAAHCQAALDAPVTVDFQEDPGLTVVVNDVVPLPHASGASAAALLGDRPPGDPPGQLQQQEASEVIALLEGLADAVSVNTGDSGTAVTLHWTGRG